MSDKVPLSSSSGRAMHSLAYAEICFDLLIISTIMPVAKDHSPCRVPSQRPTDTWCIPYETSFDEKTVTINPIESIPWSPLPGRHHLKWMMSAARPTLPSSVFKSAVTASSPELSSFSGLEWKNQTNRSNLDRVLGMKGCNAVLHNCSSPYHPKYQTYAPEFLTI